MKRTIAFLAVLGLALCAVPAHAAKTLYADTLSTNGRAADSTAYQAVTPGKEITIGFKIEGMAGGTHRLAIVIRWHPFGTVDSTWTWSDHRKTTFTSSSTLLNQPAHGLPDSIQQIAGGTAAIAWRHETVLSWLSSATVTPGWYGRWIPVTFRVPEGIAGYSISFRLISMANAVGVPLRLRIVRA